MSDVNINEKNLIRKLLAAVQARWGQSDEKKAELIFVEEQSWDLWALLTSTAISRQDG